MYRDRVILPCRPLRWALSLPPLLFPWPLSPPTAALLSLPINKYFVKKIDSRENQDFGRMYLWVKEEEGGGGTLSAALSLASTSFWFCSTALCISLQKSCTIWITSMPATSPKIAASVLNLNSKGHKWLERRRKHGLA